MFYEGEVGHSLDRMINKGGLGVFVWEKKVRMSPGYCFSWYHWQEDANPIVEGGGARYCPHK